VSAVRHPAVRDADAAAHAPVSPPAPSERRRRRLGAPHLALAGLVLACAAAVQWLAQVTGTFTPDEWYTVIGGRLLEQDLLANLTSGHFNRGPERLASLLQVPPNALLGDAVDALRASHVVLAITYFLTAVPVYLLARGLGLTRWQGVATAAVAIVTPWAVYGATTLNVTVGLPAVTLLAYAAWRAAVRPSVWNDVFVLVAAVLNLGARTGHAPFFGVALLAVAYAVWLRRPAGEPLGRSLLRFPLRVARTHPVIVGTLLLAAAAVAMIGVTRFVGSGYASASQLSLPWDSIWLHLRDWFVQLTMATGYLPMLIGVPWMLWQAARPSRLEHGVFAVVALGLFVVFVYVTSAHNSVSEERYVAPLGALPAVAFGAAVFLRQAWPLGTLIVGLLAARAIATLGPFITEFDDYVEIQVAPARTFWQEVVIGRATVTLPGGDTNIVLIVTVLLVAVAVVLAWLLSERAPRPRAVRPVAVGAVLAVLTLGFGSAAWATVKYRNGLPPETMERHHWLDPVTRGEPALMWSHWWDTDSYSGRIYLGLLTQYFNDDPCCNLFVNDLQDIIGPEGVLPDDRPYVVSFAGFLPLAFDRAPVHRERYGAEVMEVRRFDGPAYAALRVYGVGPDGTIPVDGQAQLAKLRAQPAGRCVSVELNGPAGLRYAIRGGERTVRGRTRGSVAVREVVPLPASVDLLIRASQGERRTLRLGTIAVGRCGTPGF
jgi:hypothetical protein